ncbi:hypothetical protein GO988_09830 [Hymenobacter sp. HMF4947]|uniref:Uncharacterized protein n=1 Tax=Hymenobacter ginkgonis TaxID=2682976 RepID=A0A7K1TE98_9BACT|nr:hypothetical protein [Hymenobacter ginkgonis]MVN76622.1 hypothetical protein [Hymenobacter ginkgonis]
MKFYFLLLSGLLSGLASAPAHGQATARPDSSLVAASGQLRARYTAATQGESRLLNGMAYVDLTPAYIVGKPFFKTDRPQRGAIAYDGSYFERVPLLYEMSQDQVLLFDSVQAATIQLIKERVDFFDLDGHHFVRLRADSAQTIVAGFYDLLLAGPVQLLARRTKTATKGTAARGIGGSFVEDTRLLVQEHGRYHKVSKLGQVLKLFPDKKADLQKFARSNRLLFGADNREASLVAVLRYYTSLLR